MPYSDQKHDSKSLSVFHNLLTATGVAGYEESVREAFASYIRPFVDDITTDTSGNLIAHKKGSGTKVMFVAHIDEVGLMITYIDADGFLFFQPVGGIDTTLLPGQRVHIHHGDTTVVGVIGKKAIHLLPADERGKTTVKAEDLWIDIGAATREEAEQRVEIGDYITYSTTPQMLTDDVVLSKSLDDRAGVFTLYEIARLVANETLSCDLYLVASVQEEIGCRGVRTAAFALQPEIGIAIDVTHATDYPTVSPKKSGNIELGKGVVIAKGPNIDHQICEQLKQVAKHAELNYQLEAIPHPTGTDANFMQVTATGIRTALLSIPCRYMHTANEVVSVNDIRDTATLAALFVKQF